MTIETKFNIGHVRPFVLVDKWGFIIEQSFFKWSGEKWIKLNIK